MAMLSLLDFVRGLAARAGVVREKGFLSEKMAKLIRKEASEDAMISGNFSARHIRDGRVIATIETPNYIVNAGLNEVASLISTSGTGSKFSAISVGTNSGATAATQTALLGESHRAVFADAIASNTATFTATFNFTGTYTLYEAGIFNHTTTGGDMLSRRTFSALNVENGDSLVITWSITVNRS